MSASLRTDSVAAFLASLDIHGPVGDRPGKIIPGPPAWALEIALRLFGGRVFNSASVRQIFLNLGVSREDLRAMEVRLRSRRLWTCVWLDVAESHVARGNLFEKSGDVLLAGKRSARRAGE